MRNLKTIRKRIASVRSTQKITRAMKIVAAAKLRRAQEAIVSLRPYSNRLHDLISHLAERAGRESHPLLAERPEAKKVGLLVLTGDKGLAGAFNMNICRKAEAFLREHSVQGEGITFQMVGKKGYEYFRRRSVTIGQNYRGILDNPSLQTVLPITKDVIHSFLDRDLDEFYMVYNEFKSAVVQQVVVERLLPVEPVELEDGGIDYLYEPSKEKLLEDLLPRYVETQVLRAVLESVAAEHGARMTAMENATENANEMIAQLTLQYNKARQEAITTELMDIVGGAEAMK